MNCDRYREQASNVWQYLGMLNQITFSVLTVFSSIRLYRFSTKTSYFHPNFKIFVDSMVVANIIHSIFIIALLVGHAIAWKVLDPCDVLVPAQLCLSFRGPILITYILNSLLLFGMSIERSMATFQPDTYAKHSTNKACMIIAVLIFASLTLAWFSMKNYDFKYMFLYCSSVTPSTVDDVSTLSIILGSLEMFALVYTAIVPIYTFIAPLIMQNILSRGAQMRRQKLNEVRVVSRNPNDVYFNLYSNMWTKT
ncbi:unnamed protein product [Caenorhabditis auriculariae]|uniref:G-protein coupled receptors family 1 profile domain-containing protein n=1 Tax=Caenorhabditis auriculariae TaxID=2777116 RepID=A0A8S1H4P6_9PELO|nr:unnamed protein product [Caenorhabditis auriculariae]